jgi:hypothetical protein
MARPKTKDDYQKGDRVRVKGNGKRGTVVGELSGFFLVHVDGWNRDYGYLPNEIEPDA